MTNNPMVMFPLSASGGGGGVDPGAMHYKGSVAQASDLPANPDPGDTYKASAAFTLDGEQVEAGDILIWNDTDSAWDIYQGNITGVVSGPSSSTDGNLAVFDGTSGKVLKDGGTVPDVWGILNLKWEDTVSSGYDCYNITGKILKNAQKFSGDIYMTLYMIGGYSLYQDTVTIPSSGSFTITVRKSNISDSKLCLSLCTSQSEFTSGHILYTTSFVIQTDSIALNKNGYVTGTQVYDYVQENGFNPSSMETVTETAVLSYPQGQIVSGNTGLVTGGQIYDYVSTQIGDIETALAQI